VTGTKSEVCALTGLRAAAMAELVWIDVMI